MTLRLKKKNNKHSHRSQKISPNSPGQETKIGFNNTVPLDLGHTGKQNKQRPTRPGLYSWGQERKRRQT